MEVHAFYVLTFLSVILGKTLLLHRLDEEKSSATRLALGL